MGADIVNLANVLSTQTAAIAPDAQAKQVLKEAVDAVVNSFAKHTQGYGRGKCAIHSISTATLFLLPHVSFLYFVEVSSLHFAPSPFFFLFCTSLRLSPIVGES